MCYRTIHDFDCGHSEQITSKCCCRYSSLVPKRCLPTFTLPTTKAIGGKYTSCSIKQMNATRAAKEAKMLQQFEEVGRQAKLLRANHQVASQVDQQQKKKHQEKNDWQQA